MKKQILLLAAAAMLGTAHGQNFIHFHMKDGTSSTFNTTKIDSVRVANYSFTVFDGKERTMISNTKLDSISFSYLVPKETYFPRWAWNVEQGNDYQNENSQFCVQRMDEGISLVAFWEKGFGDNPETCPDATYRFPMKDVLAETEKMFDFYRDSLKFVEKGSSLTDKYRMVLYFYYNTEGTVYGGGSDNKVGAMWISPNRVKTKPYGAMAHELGHAFQYMAGVDINNPNLFHGPFWEMTSQFMLWQYYPTWITFENYHLTEFLLRTHLAFMHQDNAYHSPFVLEYWADKHGKDFVGKLWRSYKNGDDPVIAYKRMTGIDQATFNDEMFDAARKFVTWDMDRVRNVSRSYANKHSSAVEKQDDGWYQIAKERCPQNYGYNAIRLDVPEGGTEITLDFKGVAGATGFSNVNVAQAGWRYGFLAMSNTGVRTYGDVYSDAEGQAKFTVPEGTGYLWLVVSGTPKTHWVHNANRLEQWPYQFKLTGTTLHSSVTGR